MEMARSAMQAGDELRDRGDLDAALRHYRSAHAIMHVPTTGLAVAQTEAGLGLLVQARSSAMEVINLPGEEEESVVFARARSAAVDLAERLQPRISSIQVSVTPPTAAYLVVLDDKQLSEAARTVPVKVNPGNHRVEIRAPGFVSEQRELALEDGESSRLMISLAPVARVGERAVAAAPVPSLPQNAVATAVPAYMDAGADDVVNAQRTRAVIGLTAGGVCLLAGAITGLASILETAELKGQCDEGYCGEQRLGELSTANTLANVANVALPLGLVGIGYGLYELLTLDTSERDSTSPAGARRRNQHVRWNGPAHLEVHW